MSINESMINNLNKLIREDDYIKELCGSVGLELDSALNLIKRIYDNMWFDTMDELGSSIIGKELGITFPDGMTQSEKNSLVEAKWKSKGKVDEQLLQSICDSWKNGEVDVEVGDGELIMKFVGLHGIPIELSGLKKMIEKAKPAYMIVDYIFRYLTIYELQNMTCSEVEKLTLDKFAY